MRNAHSPLSLVCLAALLLAGCAAAPPYPPQYADCYERMQAVAAELMPAFGALGYRPQVQLRLDEEMRNGRGFRAPDQLLGDALPSGRIRLRASAVCGSDVLARAVVAHEMAHVALRHRGMPPTGLVLEWERPPKQETEADTLALAVLRLAGGDVRSALYLECHLGKCAGHGAGTAYRLPEGAAP